MEVVDRTRQRFDLREVAWVTDRGMISAKTIRGLEERGLRYILGARMRAQKEVREDVLRSLVGNAGYRRVLRVERGSIRLDEHQITLESRFDGKYVLRTNTDLPASEVALQYQRLLQVERLFRAAKATLATQPIYHPWDSTIHGHVFCSFLALILMDELQRRMTAKGRGASWDQVLKDLRSVCEVPVRKDDQWYVLRTPLQGVAGKVLQAAGVAPPPPCRPCGVKAER